MENRTFRADERLNELSDRDDVWGPLLFLRPEPHEVMSRARVLTLAGLLGGFYGMLGNAVIALAARGVVGSAGKPSVWLMPALFTAMCFVCAKLSIVGAWNRRARLMARRNDWVETTRRATPDGDDGTAAE